jgi:hypothetical protein
METYMSEHTPWCGPEYELGVDRERIAIVGYSHWLSEDEEDTDKCTIDVVSRVISGEYSDNQFFKQIENYFGFESTEAFWNRMLFFNYLPDSIGTGDDRFRTGTSAQIDRAKERFARIIEQRRPNKLLVFSKKGWETFPQNLEEQAGNDPMPLGGEFPEFSWGTYNVGAEHHIVMAFGLRHPQGAKGELMRRAVQRILAMSPIDPLRANKGSTS